MNSHTAPPPATNRQSHSWPAPPSAQRKQEIQNKVKMDPQDEILESFFEEFSPPPSPPPAENSDEYEEEEGSDEQDVEEEEEQEHEFHDVRGVRPYMFEPLLPPANESDGEEGRAAAAAAAEPPHPREHLDVSIWCTCGHCQNMDAAIDRVCCKDHDRVMDKCAEAEPDVPECITLHPGFAACCLSPWVQQMTYSVMHQRFGEGFQGEEEFSEDERYRYTAYRSFVRWCWGYLGQGNRRVVPSCAVTQIRAAYPSPAGQYTGFRLPPLHTHHHNRHPPHTHTRLLSLLFFLPIIFYLYALLK